MEPVSFVPVSFSPGLSGQLRGKLVASLGSMGGARVDIGAAPSVDALILAAFIFTLPRRETDLPSTSSCCA